MENCDLVLYSDLLRCQILNHVIDIKSHFHDETCHLYILHSHVIIFWFIFKILSALGEETCKQPLLIQCRLMRQSSSRTASSLFLELCTHTRRKITRPTTHTYVRMYVYTSKNFSLIDYGRSKNAFSRLQVPYFQFQTIQCFTTDLPFPILLVKVKVSDN